MVSEPSTDAVRAFRAEFGGSVLGPDDEDYDDARAVWNGTIDRRPAAIARCRGVADVIAALELARGNDLPIAVRGGGHNVAGHAVCDDGVVIDLGAMDGVRVDPAGGTVRAGAGATIGDVDRETQVFGLATPLGVVTDTGIAGLTLGGGVGHLRRAYGLSCDDLVSADVVTADGEVLTASETENADLFWAIRGGGGNFGVVTSFEYRLHEVGPEVAVAFPWYPGDQAREVLARLADWHETAPDAISALAFHAVVPEEDPFPEARRGEAALAVLACHAGDPHRGGRELRPLREFADPIVDLSGRMAYTDLQSMLDEDYPDGMRYYWKSLYLPELTAAVIDRIVAAGERAPSPLSTVDVWQLGGAIDDVPADGTAYAARGVPFMLGIEANWEDPTDDAANVAWARDVFAEMRPYSTGGVYVNFPGYAEDDDLVDETYAANLGRLAAVKARYDPDNLFDRNQNVAPADRAD